MKQGSRQRASTQSHLMHDLQNKSLQQRYLAAVPRFPLFTVHGERSKQKSEENLFIDDKITQILFFFFFIAFCSICSFLTVSHTTVLRKISGTKSHVQSKPQKSRFPLSQKISVLTDSIIFLTTQQTFCILTHLQSNTAF